MTAAITDVRATCQDSGDDVVSTVTFTVVALRRDPGPARQVILPYFDVALRGGSRVAAKQVGQASLMFAAGESARLDPRPGDHPRQSRRGDLAANVREILTRPRKAGEVEAAIDPMSDPAVRKAVANATFEHLVGFQLTQDQLRYNATR